MAFLHRYSIRHPVVAIVVAALVTLAAAPGMVRLKLRTDGHALVPDDRPEVAYDRKVRDEFDFADQIVVLITSEHPDGIFNTGTLRLIQEFTDEFQGLPGVRPHHVSSLATEHSHRVKTGTLTAKRFLEPLPDTPEALARLRGDLAKIQLHTGTVVSFDGKSASILVGVPAGADRTDMYNRIQELSAAHGPTPERVRVVGAPVAEALLGTHILEDLGVPRTLLGLRAAQEETNDTQRLPRSLHEVRVWVGRHVGLVPIAIIIMAVVFVLAFRSLTAAVLPLIEVGACLVFVFGLMGWVGVPIYLTIAVMPVILTAIGVADEIHVFARYAQELRARPDVAWRESLSATMDEMWVPVVKTSVTTVVGFLSFAASPQGPVRAFGVFTAAGIVFCMLWSLSVIPAMLALIQPRRFVDVAKPGATDRPLGERFFAWLGAGYARFRWGRYAVLAAAVVVVVVAPFGVSRVTVQDSWIDGFAPDSEFYQATQQFDEQFLGTHLLLLRVQADDQRVTGQVPGAALARRQVVLPGDLADDPAELVGRRLCLGRSGYSDGPQWTGWIVAAKRDGQHLVLTPDRSAGARLPALRPQSGDTFDFELRSEPFMMPEVIRRVGELEAFIRGKRELTVGGVIGTASYVSTAHFMSRSLQDGTCCVPEAPVQVEDVWKHVERIRGPERLRQVVDADYTRSLVTVFLKNANFVDVKALMAAIREYEREHLAPDGMSLGFAGDVAVSQTVIDAIVTTQTWSLVGSLVGILAITAIMGRSLGWGLLSVLPCGLAILVNFALMGWTGMPLGVATSMFAGMTLGIGVDFAIHLLERYRLARGRGLDSQAAVTDSLTVAGPAIVIDALAVALGFGILTLSQVPANARLGGLLVLSIAGCLAATVLLLPALLARRHA